MNRVNTYAFYELGNKLRICSDIQENTLYGDVWFELDKARDVIRALLDNGVVTVKTCRESAEALITAITAVVPDGFLEASSKEKSTAIDWFEAHHIKSGITKLETVLSAELGLLDTYVVSQKNAYSTPDLIFRAELLIPESLRGLLPKQAVIDIQQAGRCIAFDIATGSAFHILRATETVIRTYYKHVTGSLPKVKMRNWGAYAKNLRSVDANQKIIGHIEHLKDVYRNPILHPEENLTPDQAQMFLGMCVSAMCQMLIEISTTAPALSKEKPDNPAGAELQAPLREPPPLITAADVAGTE